MKTPLYLDKYFNVMDALGQQVRVEGFILTGGSGSEARQNSADVIRAVNSHAKLVEALRGMIDNNCSNPKTCTKRSCVAALKALKEAEQ